MKKKNLLYLLLPIFLLALIFAVRYQNQEVVDYNSKSVFVYNLTNDKKITGYNENEKLPMASLTKIMTCLVGLENIEDLGAIAPIDTESYQRLVKENASMAGFFGAETTTYRDLLYGAMLPSGGEASDSLAINISGSTLAFVELMNDKAKELKLTNTHFQNVDGMDQVGHYSSAKDIAMLLKYALDNENFRAIFTKREYISTPTADHPQGLYMQSTIFKHLDDYRQDGFEIIGGKSGTTDKAGLCWATLATKNGKEYIIVTMGAPYEDINNPGDGQIKDTLDILERL
ncbi:D-alanyl-D-alanine carboxypeptidase family protein [uncultured Anaerococcus sp.]|uniref:D-alanyl-D-alanine carboxypeptidase family protein n=1 Tax=uncultured Anaerococcus sp. TaxID=293428 RepID=UPI002606D435|nr:serine hydrolase [uncultured Anaerococcus sp.]